MDVWEKKRRHFSCLFTMRFVSLEAQSTALSPKWKCMVKKRKRGEMLRYFQRTNDNGKCLMLRDNLKGSKINSLICVEWVAFSQSYHSHYNASNILKCPFTGSISFKSFTTESYLNGTFHLTALWEQDYQYHGWERKWLRVSGKAIGAINQSIIGEISKAHAICHTSLIYYNTFVKFKTGANEYNVIVII